MTDDVVPLRNSHPWLYCGKCGTPMEWRLHGQAYNRTTGRRGDTFAWTCPHFSGGSGTSAHDRANRVVHDIRVESVSQ